MYNDIITQNIRLIDEKIIINNRKIEIINGTKYIVYYIVVDLIILIFIWQGFFIFHLKGNGQYVKAKKEFQIEDERKGRESKFLTQNILQDFTKP